MPKTPRKFIFRSEVLLAYCRSEKFGDFLMETATIGTVFETETDALAHYNGDDIIRFVRFDTVTMTGEDVTEQMARVYSYTEGLGTEDEDKLPLFVRGCDDVMGAFREEWRQVNAAAAQYSTLNHRAQGISA